LNRDANKNKGSKQNKDENKESIRC